MPFINGNTSCVYEMKNLVITENYVFIILRKDIKQQKSKLVDNFQFYGVM